MNSQQEQSNLSRRETERPERTNNAIPSPFGRAPLNSRVGALKLMAYIRYYITYLLIFCIIVIIPFTTSSM